MIGRHLLGVALLLTAAALQAEPWIPDNDDEVIEQLTKSVFFKAKPLPQQLKITTDNPQAAAKLARQYISAGRSQSNPRYFGYAQAAITPWSRQAQPPVEILLIRAILKQRNHQYQAAVSDLKKLTARQPRHSQAWLTLSSIQLVQGQYPQARKSCAALAKAQSSGLSLLCYGQLMALAEDADRGYVLIKTLLQRLPEENRITRQWLHTLLAEISTRSAKNQRAEYHFKHALAVPLRDPYLLRVYSEFLRQNNRAEEVIPLLQQESHDDALLLELALAAQQSGDDQQLHGARKALKQRFHAEKLRGSTLHQREHARFLLDIEGQPDQALSLAKRNWILQKEPADAHLLLAAAIQNKDIDSIQEIVRWQSHSGIQDHRLRSLLATTDTL